MTNALTTPLPYHVITRTRNGQTERGIELRFHQGQQRAYDSTARIVAMISGSQGGKTTFGPWWLYREITTCGPGDYLAVAPTYDLFKLKMLPAIREVMEHTLGIARYWAGDQVLEICEHVFNESTQTWMPKPGSFTAQQSTDPMWARVILRSASSEGGLESATARAAWLDEAGMEEFGLGAWEAILRRLALHRGRVLITTTPYNNTGWLKREIYDRWRAGDRQIEVIQFASIQNPAFPKEEFDERQRTMAAWKFNMFYRGQFERPAGLVYPDFRDEGDALGGHIIAPFPIPYDWPRILGVDPGPVYYTLLHGALHPDLDMLYITREEIFSYRSTDEIVRELLYSLASADDHPFDAYFVGGASDVQARLDWINAGAHPVYEPPFSSVEVGIDRVTSVIRKGRLRIFSPCMGLRDEFNSYRRELDSQGLPTEKIVNQNAYHRLDALRYICAGITTHRVLVITRAPALLVDYRGG